MPDVALVTGAKRGIGLDVARQLAERGYATLLGSRDPAKGRDAAARLARDGIDVLPCALDIADGASVARLFREVVDVHGRLDILVNNAGIRYDTWQGALDADLETRDMGGAGGRPVARGAASILWAVQLPDGGPTGGFFRDGQPMPW